MAEFTPLHKVGRINESPKDEQDSTAKLLSDAVATTSSPRCTTHFLTKFNNQDSEDDRLYPQVLDDSYCLLVSKKHSGSLLMAPPFYSKNSTGNRFSRLGAIVCRNYFCAVWDEAIDNPETFAAWWADSEARGLCYSFELVVPRILGDHGATPK